MQLKGYGMKLIQKSIAVLACAFIPALSSAQSGHATERPVTLRMASALADVSTIGADIRAPGVPFHIDWSTTERHPAGNRFDLDHPASPSPASKQRGTYAHSFEQLQLLVGPGDRISIREGSEQEFSGRVVTLTSGELVVTVNGHNRAFRSDDTIQIRQRRGDSLANGTWWGFGIGAGFALIAVAVDNGLGNDAGWAIVAAAVYGGIGAGIGVAVDALIRSRPVIYDHPPSPPPTVAVAPLIGTHRAGALVALRF